MEQRWLLSETAKTLNVMGVVNVPLPSLRFSTSENEISWFKEFLAKLFRVNFLCQAAWL
jgi:c-di-AMP phosphodiesterase-like protein